MAETIRLEDMRIFAKVAEAKSFTAAARQLGVPKQTLSRRVADLERALGVRLMHRTTRRLHLTDAGAAYAERCSEIVRVAEEANRAVADAQVLPSGTLRVTADPVFGEAFLDDLVIAYARRYPEVRVEVVLTRRRVDLIEELFDVAFRVGHVDEPALAGFALGPARVRYCVSPEYARRRGSPTTPNELAAHDCIAVGSPGAPIRWPFRGANGMTQVPISARYVFTSFAMARAATIAGLGVAIFPEFACADDLRHARLIPVLDDCVVEVGSVWLVHAGRFPPARVRAFVDLAREQLARDPPWIARAERRRHTRRAEPRRSR